MVQVVGQAELTERKMPYESETGFTLCDFSASFYRRLRDENGAHIKNLKLGQHTFLLFPGSFITISTPVSSFVYHFDLFEEHRAVQLI
jgi:hypothetical protein